MVASFDMHNFQRVESRAVTLLLAAVPNSVRDDIITNRWLSTASVMFRILCAYQPGGSSERAQLLSQLVSPEQCKGFQEAIKIFRRWQQLLQRATEIRATLPDASLLLRGVDQSTAALLASSPMIAFRVNSFRHSVALGYNPTTAGVTQLVRLLQAESEAAVLVDNSGPGDKRARTAAVNVNREQPSVKAPPTPPPPPNPQVSAVGIGTDGRFQVVPGVYRSSLPATS